MNRKFVALLFALLGSSALAELPPTHATNPARGFKVVLVPSLPGLAEPKQQVSLSVPVDGVLSHVFVVEGERVEPNTILAKLDTRSLEKELQVAEAQADNEAGIQRAEHTLDFAKRALDRSTKMLKNSAVSKRSYDEAKTSYDIAISNYQAIVRDAETAKLRCDVVRTAIDVRSIRAPFPGRILKVLAQPGKSMKVEGTVAVLANLDELQIDLHLPIAIYSKVEIGRHYQLVADVPEPTLVDAKLISIEPVLNAAVGTFRCRFEFDNRVCRYPIGFAVRLAHPAGATDWPKAETVHVAISQK